MLNEGYTYLATAPRLALYPGAAIMIIALAFNLLGDGLRDISTRRRCGDGRHEPRYEHSSGRIR